MRKWIIAAAVLLFLGLAGPTISNVLPVLGAIFGVGFIAWIIWDLRKQNRGVDPHE